jgi:4-amino-4-deoxy-L-arabinose transferase-like glycosyltransferase
MRAGNIRRLADLGGLFPKEKMSKKTTRSKKQPQPKEGREIFVLFALAFALRMLGISWGIPTAKHIYSYHPDEIHVLSPTVLYMLRGDWNPHFFNYGTLYLYLVGFVSKLFALIGLSPGNMVFAQIGNSPTIMPDLSFLHLIGRTITALLGAGSIVLIYLIGKKLGGRGLGIGAALLLTFAPLHLVNSHFATVDVPATFLLLLAAHFCLNIIAEGKLRWYLLAGAAVGLAAATKYTLAAGIVLMIGAHLLRGRFALREHLPLAAGLLAVPLCFLIGCPYALTFEGGLAIRPEFLQGFRFEAQHMREVRTAAFVETGSGWLYHAVRGLPAALGIPLYLLSLAGLALSILYKPPAGSKASGREAIARKGFLLFACWCIFFFVMIGFASERFIRYLVPLIPFLCLFAAWPLGRLFSSSIKFRKPVLAGLGVMLALTLLYSLSQLLPFIYPDARDRSMRAIGKSTVGILETPWFQIPPVSPLNGGALSRVGFEKWQRDAPYKVIITGWNAEALEKEKPESFVISDMQYTDPLRLNNAQAKSFMEALDLHYTNKETYGSFTPMDWLGGGRENAPPDWLYLSPAEKLYSGWKND